MSIQEFKELDKFNWESKSHEQSEIDQRNNLIKSYCLQIDNKLERAIEFATMAHNGIYRKFVSGSVKTPYIIHPTRVAHKVGSLPMVTSFMIEAAYLHDTVEDCYIPLSMIEELFGKEVAQIVDDLTEKHKKDKDENGNLLHRSVREARECARLSKIQKDSKRIKMCDRIDNLKDMPKGKFLDKYIPESWDVLKAVGGADPELAAELARLISSLS